MGPRGFASFLSTCECHLLQQYDYVYVELNCILHMIAEAADPMELEGGVERDLRFFLEGLKVQLEVLFKRTKPRRCLPPPPPTLHQGSILVSKGVHCAGDIATEMPMVHSHRTAFKAELVIARRCLPSKLRRKYLNLWPHHRASLFQRAAWDIEKRPARRGGGGAVEPPEGRGGGVVGKGTWLQASSKRLV